MLALASSLQADCLPHPDEAGLLRATLTLQQHRPSTLAAAWFH